MRSIDFTPLYRSVVGFDRLADGAIRTVLRGMTWNYAHLPLLAGLVSVAVGTEFAIREAATGQLERATTLTLGGGTAVYLLSTVVIGLAIRSRPDRMLWLWLASAAVALAVGFVWPSGGRPSRPRGRAHPSGVAQFASVFHVEHGRSWQASASSPALPTMRRR